MAQLLWSTRRAGRARLDEARALGADGAAAFYDGASPFVCPVPGDLAHEEDWNDWQRGYWTARLLAEMTPFGGMWSHGDRMGCTKFEAMLWRNLPHTVQLRCDQTKWDLIVYLLEGGEYAPLAA